MYNLGLFLAQRIFVAELFAFLLREQQQGTIFLGKKKQ